MVVMQILPDLKVGGAQTSVVALCESLLGHGVQVVLVGLGKDAELIEQVQPHANLTVHVLELERRSVLVFPLFVWSATRIVWRLAAIMRRHRVDVVQGHMANASLLGALAALVGGVPKRYATFHSIVFLPRQSRMDLRNRMLLFVLRRLAPWFDRYIAVSDAVRAVLVDRGVSPDHVAVVPNGIQLEAFERVGADERDIVRRELGLKTGSRAVICVGTLREAKGHRFLLEAASQLAHEFPEVVYLLVGDGSLRSRLESLARELGVADRVHFLGTRRDIARILSVGDLFVLPSLWEGLPVALLEAMAVGLPSVATRVAGTVEVLAEGHSGILVDPGDSRRLAVGIRALLVDPAEASRMGANARSRVRELYGLENMTGRLLGLYES